MLNSKFEQDEQLYISDPRALQSIISKDQDAFEETAVFIESVSQFPNKHLVKALMPQHRTNKAIFGPGLVATIGRCAQENTDILITKF